MSGQPDDNAMPVIDQLDVSRPELYRDDLWQIPFAALRADSPVHFVQNSDFGPYWSVSTYNEIIEVESLPELYSSEEGITIAEFFPDGQNRLPMFIARDKPVHTQQRRTISKAFAPSELERMSADIRKRTIRVLESLPKNTEFDWVDKVSTELTTQMLATLFDFPWADRRKLTFWSDLAGDVELAKKAATRKERMVHMLECGAYFKNLWDAKIGKKPAPDLISMMIHSDAMAHMDHNEFVGNLILLIVGGNDTTRNSMSALAYGLDKFPEARAQLESNPDLIPNAVAEILRWQTPIAHMRRTATQDTILMGQHIRKGDRLALWYISANRDENVFGKDADIIRIDRPNARRHLSFGHGIHRCIGARLAEMQITILLEEMAHRRLRVNVLAEPTRVAACFVHGYHTLPVEISRY